MRILFMGTPDFAAASLQRLLDDGHEICGVFTQPDRPKNRGMKLQAPPVKELALQYDLPVWQPESLKNGAAMPILEELQPELIVVAAYGRLLPRAVLDFPPMGCINVHSSLLPKYRGAAPINWAILEGEEKSGVTIMHMAPELDAGDIILQLETEIGPEETAPELHDRLMMLGAEALSRAVMQIADGTATRRPQDPEQVTYASLLSREMSPLNWNNSARRLVDQVRGLQPWPAAVMRLDGKNCKVFRLLPGEAHKGPAGKILGTGPLGIRISCGQEESVWVAELQAEGKKRMAAADYLRGNPLSGGEELV